MKKTFVILLCMVGVTCMAQQVEKDGEKYHHGEKRQHTVEQRLTPEQQATLKTKRMVLALDLNKSQQEQLMSLNLANAEKREAKYSERKAFRESGSSKKPDVEARYKMQNERLDQMIAHKMEMRQILSPEQFDKWTKMNERKARRSPGEHHRKVHSKRESRK